MRFLPLLLVVPLAGCIQLGGDGSPAESEPSGVRNYSMLPAEFGNGTFVAGVDVQPGTYLQLEQQPNCEWVTGVDGDPGQSGSGDVVLDVGETIEAAGCSTFVKAD
jgi:hypothetical protein